LNCFYHGPLRVIDAALDACVLLHLKRLRAAGQAG
jgi:hypothetical protein